MIRKYLKTFYFYGDRTYQKDLRFSSNFDTPLPRKLSVIKKVNDTKRNLGIGYQYM